MRRYETLKEDVSIPADDVSLEEVEKDIQDLKSYISLLKSHEDRGFDDRDFRPLMPPATPRIRTAEDQKSAESVGDNDDFLLNLPKTNRRADIRDMFVQEYIKNLAAMRSDPISTGHMVYYDNDNNKRKQSVLLPGEALHMNFQYQVPDSVAAFDFPAHIVERSGKEQGSDTNNNVQVQMPVGHISHSVSGSRKKQRHKKISTQGQKYMNTHATRNQKGSKILTEQTMHNSGASPTSEMSQQGVDKMNSGESKSTKMPTSEHIGQIGTSNEDSPEHGKDQHENMEIHETENSKQTSRRRHRQKSTQAVEQHPVNVKPEFVASPPSAKNHSVDHRQAVSVEKRRGHMGRGRGHNTQRPPHPKRPPPSKPQPQPKPVITPTTTTTEVTTSTTTEMATLSTQSGGAWTTPVNRTMEEIIDSGVDKIDLPLSGPTAWNTIIHGRRDVLLAGTIVGGIGLLLILLSFIYMCINRRRSQKKTTASAVSDKDYQKFGTPEETAGLTTNQHNLFPLSSDEDTAGESDEDSGLHQSQTKGAAR